MRSSQHVKMSFFIRGKKRSKSNDAANKKVIGGKHGTKNSVAPKSKKAKFLSGPNANIDSDSDYEIDGQENAYVSSDEEVETAQEKKLRLAKKYLDEIKSQEEDLEDDRARQTDPIAHRLKQDVLAQKGKLHKEVAQSIQEPTEADICVFRGHNLAVTCLVISPTNKHIFSASKDCCIIKWDIVTGERIHKVKGCQKKDKSTEHGHSAHILCLAISSDGQFLASGDRDKLIHIWKPEDLQFVHTLTGHRDAVSALSFRKGSHQLFSASHDRSVKVWNLDEMAYVETLYGHQDAITGIDSLARERAVTCGGRDASVRIWKIPEESQLVFNGPPGSIDCIALINEENVVTGTDDNSLSIWGVMKKKPLFTLKEAHKSDDASENWITSIASLQHTDLLASGSKDGCVRLWQCGKDFKSITPVTSVPVKGFVNSLRFSPDGNYLVAGVGQEHRLGRWWRVAKAKNSIVVIKLNKNT